ncbi:MAG: hypothetical protein F7B60_02095 [Desulfurococcales archaeon]|nr:hypothetical protein [Desulfurococcales archaeon]
MNACVRAFARIHLGFYTYPPHPNPWRGSGIYLSSPHVTVCITQGKSCFPSCIGAEQRNNVIGLVGEEAGVEIHGCIPPHRGLGSSTQLYLATAKALALYKGERFDWKEMVSKLGRFKTSRVGALLFKYGGLVIDGSEVVGGHQSIKSLYHASLPRNWTILLVDPGGTPGPGEEWEENMWATLPVAQREMNDKGERIVKTLAYAANLRDLDSFVKAAVELDRLTGQYFSTLNQGVTDGLVIDLVNALSGEGVVLMQSSWGPTLYTITASKDAVKIAELAKEVSTSLGFHAVEVSVVKPRNNGAALIST